MFAVFSLETYLYRILKAENMVKILNWLMPKEKKLLEMLAEQSQNALEAAKELKLFVDDYEKLERSERKSKANIIKNIEHKADEATHKLMELNKNFTAPSREYFYEIIILLEGLIDLINAVASRFVILSIERIEDYIPRLVDIVFNSATETTKIISNLKKSKHSKEHYAKRKKIA